jgi:phosphoribosyl 1,2-cyclic phosphodiesterase
MPPARTLLTYRLACMNVTFHGTRGSYPLHAEGFTSLGGNTSCLELTHGPGGKLFVDAGSGLLEAEPSGATDIVFFSHFHVDHLIGLPFFLGKKKKQGGDLILLTGVFTNTTEFNDSIDNFYGGRYFPINMKDILPTLRYQCLGPGMTTVADWTIEGIELNHPGGCVGGRFSHRENTHSLVYASDHEHGTKHHDNLTAFANGADLLVYDSSFSDETYQQYKGWGHSTWQMGIETGEAANVKRVALTHHDVTRSDLEAEKIEAQCAQTRGFVARDHMRVTLG